MYLIDDEMETLWTLVTQSYRAATRRQFIFTIQFPVVPGTQMSELRMMKGWFGLATTQWFWTEGPSIEKPVP